MDWLNYINTHLPSADSALVTIAGTIIVDLILRKAPTSKPASIAHTISYVLRTLSSIFVKIASIIDKIFPQNLK